MYAIYNITYKLTLDELDYNTDANHIYDYVKECCTKDIIEIGQLVEVGYDDCIETYYDMIADAKIVIEGDVPHITVIDYYGGNWIEVCRTGFKKGVISNENQESIKEN